MRAGTIIASERLHTSDAYQKERHRKQADAAQIVSPQLFDGHVLAASKVPQVALTLGAGQCLGVVEIMDHHGQIEIVVPFIRAFPAPKKSLLTRIYG